MKYLKPTTENFNCFDKGIFIFINILFLNETLMHPVKEEIILSESQENLKKSEEFIQFLKFSYEKSKKAYI